MRGGGRDRAELRGFNPDRYLEDDDPNKTLGCHKGLSAGLNIRNAQPGWYYSWADTTDPRNILKARQNLKQVVQAEDPERAGYADMLGFDNNEMDSANTGMSGVVLVKRSTRNERRVKAEEQKRRENLLRRGDAERNYRAQASDVEIASGGRRLQREDHRSYATEGPSDTGRQLDSWTPGQ